MSENRTIRLAEIPIGGSGGLVWNRLHCEREDLCEAMLKETSENNRDMLQARLRNVDDALDRLMSGFYGKRSNGELLAGAVGPRGRGISPYAQ
jgi:hypothetical protein